MLTLGILAGVVVGFFIGAIVENSLRSRDIKEAQKLLRERLTEHNDNMVALKAELIRFNPKVRVEPPSLVGVYKAQTANLETDNKVLRAEIDFLEDKIEALEAELKNYKVKTYR